MHGKKEAAKNLTVSLPSELSAYIDHTLLKADATEANIENLCAEARCYGFKAVCVNPIHVKRARAALGDDMALVASVIGFPLGANMSEIKALEAERALLDGAAEIDMVIRLDLVKGGHFKLVERDIEMVVSAAGGAPVKVILETGLLTREEIKLSCRASEAAGAAFVKTSTGFLGRGATIEDVELMRQSCSTNIEIKASGGIKTFEQAQALIAAGATRLGTSAGVALVTGQSATGSY